jgi:hypothetical protein
MACDTPPVSYFAQSLDYKMLTLGLLLQSLASKGFIFKVLKTNGHWAFASLDPLLPV